MKKILLISLLLFSKITFSQVTDSFTDGDFFQNPPWNGDIAYFQINSQSQLQSKGQQIASQTISLSTANKLSLDSSWEFFIQLNFNPTSTNFVRIYLTSDKENLEGSLNGYFVQIGETGVNDGFHLYKQTGTSTTKIINGPQKVRANANLFLAKVKVTRDASGKWSLFTDISGGNNFNLEGSATDNTYKTSEYAGFYCKYATASRYNQYIFDDFKIDDLVPDLIPPSLKTVSVINPTTLEVAFSEALDIQSATMPDNYYLSNSYATPIKIEATASQNIYRLIFEKVLESGSYNLQVKNVVDKRGNSLLANSSLNFIYIKPYTAKYGDVVINEIFANPTGNPSLPQREFVEVWNTTNEYILTQGWKYADQSSTYTFLIDTIKPNQHVILTAKADESLFKPFGKTIGLSPWPSLNNDKDILTLSDNTGNIIDKVAYSDTWYKDETKKKGGFSLELIDPKNICKGSQNWIASADNFGATPGKQNAVYGSQKTNDILKLSSANILDSITVQIEFSKSIDSLSASIASNYVINNGVGNPKSVIIESPDFKTVTIQFLTAFTRGIENTIIINNVTDCAGSLISPTTNTAKLFLAKKIEKHDILISEVLFNPRANGADFVEIYNHSEHILDLKDLQIANLDTKGLIANVKSVSSKSLFIKSSNYWVISTNPVNIKQNYLVQHPDNFIELPAMPAYNNDRGSVIILSNNVVIDRLDYDAKSHHPLINDEDGISIERVSFNIDANAAGNFKSAASTVGFATPTYKNSQEYAGNLSFVKLKGKTFSPDGDGFEDILNLEYQLEDNASLATVNVFSDKGRLIKKLLKNQTIATAGNLTWDGLSDNGENAAIGIYVLVFDVFDPKGNTKRFKTTCVLAAKLN
ncbi:lamin tail domain-containing protein [Pedobacter sp. Leaf132]|uniref:lamin tail domain-containing protein n=1 Tax=Pedobacter sp. Leaf132 TaxID=2876557 RepID=UPI001E46314F|nr:lamin tail domain-containing protein [Pedobacter sp. Leaf132]